MRSRFKATLLAVALLSSAVPAAAQDLSIAAASDLQSVFSTVAERFQRETGHAVRLTFGSSGNFFTQIQNGAPFDLFFSAVIDYPRQLESAHLAEPGTLYAYASGKIVLWVRKDSGIDVRRGLQALDDPRVKRVAIANPDHAPYGRAAVAALQRQGLYDRVRAKLVLGENISQAAQFVQSGNAEAGILAISLALAPALRDAGVYFEIPHDLYPAIDQAAIVIGSSRHKDLARQFIAFLDRRDISRVMQEYGFALPIARTR